MLSLQTSPLLQSIPIFLSLTKRIQNVIYVLQISSVLVSITMAVSITTFLLLWTVFRMIITFVYNDGY